MSDPSKFVKFQCRLVRAELPSNEAIAAINHCRTRLHDMRFMGVDEKGDGYGNISVRHFGNEFLITASQTGRFRTLAKKQFVLVKECVYEKNEVTAFGACMPSSESLSHGAVYESDSRIDAVIHVHHFPLWQHLMNNMYISTPRSACEGTTELARAIMRKFLETEIFQQKVFAMGGHESGVMAFGADITDAENALLKTLRFVL